MTDRYVSGSSMVRLRWRVLGCACSAQVRNASWHIERTDLMKLRSANHRPRAGATGAEALKNLVLGGVASFTIVDGARVAARDLGANFLLDAASLGSARAQAVAECLKELNDSVEGSFIVEEPAALVEANPNFLQNFDLVIATQVSSSPYTVPFRCIELLYLCTVRILELCEVRRWLKAMC